MAKQNLECKLKFESLFITMHSSKILEYDFDLYTTGIRLRILHVDLLLVLIFDHIYHCYRVSIYVRNKVWVIFIPKLKNIHLETEKKTHAYT